MRKKKDKGRKRYLKISYGTIYVILPLFQQYLFLFEENFNKYLYDKIW